MKPEQLEIEQPRREVRFARALGVQHRRRGPPDVSLQRIPSLPTHLSLDGRRLYVVAVTDLFARWPLLEKRDHNGPGSLPMLG